MCITHLKNINQNVESLLMISTLRVVHIFLGHVGEQDRSVNTPKYIKNTDC